MSYSFKIIGKGTKFYALLVKALHRNRRNIISDNFSLADTLKSEDRGRVVLRNGCSFESPEAAVSLGLFYCDGNWPPMKHTSKSF
jgi:hypothetical protein